MLFVCILFGLKFCIFDTQNSSDPPPQRQGCYFEGLPVCHILSGSSGNENCQVSLRAPQGFLMASFVEEREKRLM